MRRKRATRVPESKEAAAEKERKILKAEREASEKRMAAKRGYKMVNPITNN